MKSLHCGLLVGFMAVVFSRTALGDAIGSFCTDSFRCEDIVEASSIVSDLQTTNSCHATVHFTKSFQLSEVLYFQDLSQSLQSLRFSGNSAVISCTGGTSSGLYFSEVVNVSITDLTIKNCGVITSIDRALQYNYSSAVYFENCIDISLDSVVVCNSRGSALTVLDNEGVVDITQCVFEHSRVPEHALKSYSGGNGVFMLLKDVNGSAVAFKESWFLNNTSTSADDIAFNSAAFTGQDVIRKGRGGGLYIIVSNEASHNLIMIHNCTFRGNQAIWGGGMYMRYHGRPCKNKIVVINVTVDGNRSYRNGGGGMDIGYLLLFNTSGNYGDNYMRFVGCNFTSNSAALYGGGTSIYATLLLSSDPQTHFMAFNQCRWEGNSALSGSAIDIAPSVDQIHINGVYPVPQFRDCTFVSNTLVTNNMSIHSNITITKTGEGTVLITGFTVQLLGQTLFSSNVGSALYISSGTVALRDGSFTTFENNTGRNGGALCIMTFGTVLLYDDATLEFVYNVASLKGGAIYAYSHDPHEYISSRRCFIGYYNEIAAGRGTDHGILFSFEGNRALSDVGDDVFSSSLKSCSCTEHEGSVIALLLCIGNVSNAEDIKVMTNTDSFEFNENTTKVSVLSPIVPGDQHYSLPLTVYDEYKTERDVFYEVIRNDSHSSLRPRTSHVSQNHLQFIGDVNSSTDSILTLEVDMTTVTINLKSPGLCPAGFLLDNEQCMCATKEVFGIAYCSQSHAFLLHGFWIGFCRDNKTICSSHCPLGFCSYNDEKKSTHMLPTDLSELDHFVCGESRKGVLCGECRQNFSAYYHSYMYSCGREDHCKLGILFYVVSELLPVTLMFIAIIFFDIKFTTGSVNGFIFYAQVLDSLSIDANGAITFPPALGNLTDIHRFIYRTFNFDFFSLESLSFCLWPGANSLDAMAMKYATVFYALVLLILLIVFVNTGRCKRAFSCWRPRTIKSSATHGITAFIVVCYSQCARVSFQILSPVYLYSAGFVPADRVVFRKGDYPLFCSQHIRYALPAIAVLAVMSLIPILLILYPLIFKLLSLCKLEESKLASVISRFFPVPLLDAFQGSFKDRFRFFAGLYFLYRLFALAAYAYSPTLIIFYVFVEVQLIIVLALHSVVQPYLAKVHNVIDSLIFANLALINSLTLFNFYWVIMVGSKSLDPELVTNATLSIQAILIFLPLMCVVVYFGFAVFKKFRARLPARTRVPSKSNLDDSVDLPPLRFESYEENTTNNRSLLSKYTYSY